MEIRLANAKDSAEIARVQVDSYRAAYGDILPRSYLEHFSYDEQTQDWESLLSSEGADVVFVAAINSDEIAGYTLGKPNANEIVPYESELVALHVCADYQKRGIGYQLFTAVIRKLKNKGCNSLFLWVLADNPARRFYEKYGGVFVGKKPWQNNTYFDTNIYEVAYGWPDFQGLLQEKRL